MVCCLGFQGVSDLGCEHLEVVAQSASSYDIFVFDSRKWHGYHVGAS